MRVNYVIVLVSDMSRSVSFYRNVIGLPLKFESSEWTEFSTEGATIALHKSDPSDLNQHETHRLGAGRCRPGLSVPDLNLFHQRMVDHGVPCLQEPKHVFGARLAQYADPDGLAISVSEEKRGG